MPGKIPKEIIEQVRQASDIVEIIDGYVPLKKAGSKFKARCPFHQEKTPSFNVDPARQFFKCFGCGKGGSVIDFVMLYENLDFPATVRLLAQRAHIPIPEAYSAEQSEEQNQRERLFHLHSAVTTWWKSILHRDPIGEPARAYLKSRKINSELAGEFNLGYAPDSWDGTMNWAKSQGYDIALLEQSGLVTVNETGRRYDRWRGRLMFPICNESGQVVAFSGRLLDPNAKAAKYVNSPETPLFTKSRILFGLDKTKRAILDKRSAIVCEGQIDLIRCYEFGIRNVVAPQGTAFTELQGRLLKRYCDEVILCFDADKAGQNAADRSVDMLLACDLHVRIAAIPEGEDPDTLLLGGHLEQFQKILAEAPVFTRYLLDKSCRENDTQSPRGRSIVAEKMAAVVKKISDPTQRHTVAMEVATRLQIPLSVFQEEMEKVKDKPVHPSSVDLAGPGGDSTPSDASAALPPMAPVSDVIEVLLSLLLTHPEVVPNVQRLLDPKWLDGLGGSEILKALLDAHAHDAWEDAPHFADERPPQERDYLAGLVVNPAPLSAKVTPEDFATEQVLRIQQLCRFSRMAILEQEIKSGLLSTEELLAKSKELLDIKRSCT
jgi:DNA primase